MYLAGRDVPSSWVWVVTNCGDKGCPLSPRLLDIISGQERCDQPKQLLVNDLGCYTLRGNSLKSDVRLDAAEA